MNLPSSPLDRQHPVWICAMRPFFLLALVCAIPLLLWWGGVLAWGWPVPAVAGGAIVWHAHELVLGLAVAAVAGFALTALPEFTGVACGTCRQLRVLVGLWLLVRLGFWASGALGLPALVLAGASQLALLLGVAWVLLPALKTAVGRRHWAFAWLVLALAVTSAGFYSDALRGLPGLRWLDATVGVLMLLRALLRQGRNAPKLLFQILIGTSLIVTFADYYAGWNGIAIDAIVPILCSVTLVLNFIFAFVNRRFTENGLVYLLLNIVVGVVPYIGLTLRHSVRPPMAWVICLVISMITFLGLVIFKGRSLLAEFEKRLHL